MNSVLLQNFRETGYKYVTKIIPFKGICKASRTGLPVGQYGQDIPFQLTVYFDIKQTTISIYIAHLTSQHTFVLNSQDDPIHFTTH